MPSILLLSCLAAPVAAPALAQPANGWRAVNRTGQEAVGLVATETGAEGAKGRNRLRQPVAAGAEKAFRRRADSPCRLDLRMRLADGSEAVLGGHDVCATPTAVFEASAIRPAPEAAPARGAAGRGAARRGAGGSTGTGFLVAPNRVLTNQHVVDGCARIVLRAPSGHRFEAVPPVQANKDLDLAVLNVPGLPGPVLPFRTEPPRRGEGVITYGHPMSGVLSADPKLTSGEVSGLAGFRGDPSNLQFSAPLQPGNSGGPLLDMRARVVGITTASLGGRGARAVSLQNVNFAVKAEQAVAFLRAAGVTPSLAGDAGPDRSAVEVGEVADRAVVQITCTRGGE